MLAAPIALETVLLSAIALAAVALALLTMGPRSLLTTGLLLWGVNMTGFLGPVGEVAVVAGAAFVVLSVQRFRRIGHQYAARPHFVAYLPLIAGVMGLVLLPVSEGMGSSLRAALTSVLLGILTLCVSRALPFELVCRSSFTALFCYSVGSYLVEVAGLAPIESGLRWSGLTPNPNALGILAFSTAVLAFGVSRLAVAFALPVSLGLVILSASRGGAIALFAGVLAGVMVWVIHGLRRGPRRLLVVSAAVVGAALVAPQISSFLGSILNQNDVGLLRTDDSARQALIVDNWLLFQERPLLGYGFGLLEVQGVPGAHAFPLTMAVQSGAAGISLVLTLVGALLTLPWQRVPVVAAMIASFLVSVLSESWVFGAGYVMTTAFWLTLGTVSANLGTGTLGAPPEAVKTLHHKI